MSDGSTTRKFKISKDKINLISPFVRYVRINLSRDRSEAFIDPEYVFTYIFSGQGKINLEGDEYNICPGDIVLMPPYMLHILIPSPSTELLQYVIHFDLFFNKNRRTLPSGKSGLTFKNFLAQNTPENLLTDGPYILSPSSDESEKIRQLFLELKEHFESGLDFSELLTKSLMIKIIACFLENTARRSSSVKRQTSKSWLNLEKAIIFMHQNYTENITLHQISRHAGLSLHYFSGLFKQHTSMSVHKYLNSIRIEKAKLLISEGNYNFTQISEQVGFKDIYVFSKVFKRLELKSPSEYQKIIKDTSPDSLNI